MFVLGISFTSGGITNTSLNVLLNQAKKSLNILNVNMKKLGDFPPAVKLRLFHVSIAPILLYSSDVWGYMEASTHQVVLNKWCKCILGVKDSTANAAVAGELGQFPLIIFRKLNMIKYWYKIVTGPKTRLRYKCYAHLKSFANTPLPRHFKNWSTEIRKILIEIGQGHIWNTEYIPVSYDYFLSMAKGTLIDLYITEWYRDLNNKDKLRTHRTIKKVFGYENYLSMNSPNVRRSFTRFRTSSHCLEIEMGRYPPRTAANYRYCKQCNTHEIDDEFHFLLVCSKFQNLRLKYIPNYYRRRPSMAKFVELFDNTSIDPSLCKKIGLYIHKAFLIHE